MYINVNELISYSAYTIWIREVILINLKVDYVNLIY